MGFEKALGHVLAYEGGYVNHPNDKGGETNYGITIAVARKHGYDGPMKDIPMHVVRKIYKIGYWDTQSLDAVAATHPEIADEMFECGVNCGTRTSATFLQRALNLMTKAALKTDGKIGPASLNALAQIRTEADKATLHKILNVLQGARYIFLAEENPTQKAFIRGWLTRVDFIKKT